jgi:hypothetical protein
VRVLSPNVLGKGEILDELRLHGSAFRQGLAVDEVRDRHGKAFLIRGSAGYSLLMSPVEAEDRERLLALSFAASITVPSVASCASPARLIFAVPFTSLLAISATT